VFRFPELRWLTAEPLEPDPGHAGEGTESLAYSRISNVIFGRFSGGLIISDRLSSEDGQEHERFAANGWQEASVPGREIL